MDRIITSVSINDFRQMEMHTVEPLVLNLLFEVEIAIEKLQRYKSPGTVHILGELNQAGGNALLSENHKLINSIWSKEQLTQQWKESSITPICTKGDKTDCIKYRGISLLPTTYKILSNILVSRLTPPCRRNYFGSSVWFLTKYINY
jgi:hypothetical protein